MAAIDDLKKIMPPDFEQEVNQLGKDDPLTHFKLKMIILTIQGFLAEASDDDASTTLLQAGMIITAGRRLQHLLGIDSEFLENVLSNGTDDMIPVDRIPKSEMNA